MLPDRVLLCLPRQSKREQCAYPRPDWLADYGERLSVVDCELDEGPGTKLLGCLPQLQEQPPLCLVIVDDDMVYRTFFLETIYRAQCQDPGSSFSFYTYPSGPFIVGQGADGLSFNSTNLAGLRRFADAVLNHPQLRLVDDLWISAFLHSQGIRVRSLAEGLPSGSTIYELSHEVNQLRNLAGDNSRESAMASGVQWLLESGLLGRRASVVARIRRHIRACAKLLGVR